MTPTLAVALQQAKTAGVERLDAQLMLAHLMAQSRTWVIAHTDAPLPGTLAASWQSMLARRSAGEPLAYLLGEKEFHGLTLQVTPDVLVPRPDTETLVGWALEHLAHLPPTARVIDLGTGSGAIALALRQAHPHVAIWGIDASEAALNVARTNAAKLGLPVQFTHSHWWQALGSECFALAVSNPPYIAEGDPHLPALSFEPRLALTSGPEGLDDLRSIIQNAPNHLERGAWLLLEHGYDQAKQVQALLADRGFEQIQTRLDAAGIARCTGGRWPKRNISDISG